MPTLNSKPRSCRFILDVYCRSCCSFSQGKRGLIRGRFPRDCGELRSIASTVRSAEEEILNEWIARLLKLTRRSVKINPAFLQIGNAVRYIKCAFHIVGNHHAGHSKALLQPANQSIDAIGDYRIETG